MMRTGEKGICTYCGSFEDLHWDDVPPKNIFEHRDNLITVPCCFPCNNSASKDDQYFLLYLALREDVKQKTEHDWLFEKAKRTLRREEARGLNRALLSNLRWVPQTTSAGILLRPALGIPFDGLRAINVVTRTAKGLYFHEQGRRLPETHRVVSYDELACRNPPPARAEDARRIINLIGDVAAIPAKKVAGVFAYHWALHPIDPATSMWLLDFFGGIRFFCKSEPSGNNLLMN
jgi:hypothetical protein